MIKRKCRKNPKIDDQYLHILSTAFLYASVKSLTDAIIYYKQGMGCEDCGEFYDDCKCEYCKDCKNNRCLCELDIWNDKEIDLSKVSKISWNIAKKTLDDLNLAKLAEMIYFEFEKLQSESLKKRLSVPIVKRVVNSVDHFLNLPDQSRKFQKVYFQKLRNI